MLNSTLTLRIIIYRGRENVNVKSKDISNDSLDLKKFIKLSW